MRALHELQPRMPGRTRTAEKKMNPRATDAPADHRCAKICCASGVRVSYPCLLAGRADKDQLRTISGACSCNLLTTKPPIEIRTHRPVRPQRLDEGNRVCPLSSNVLETLTLTEETPALLNRITSRSRAQPVRHGRSQSPWIPIMLIERRVGTPRAFAESSVGERMPIRLDETRRRGLML